MIDAMDSLQQYIDLYARHGREICAHAPEALNAPRRQAWLSLQQMRLPRKGDEGYEALSVDEMLAPDYGVNINRVSFPASTAESFRCGVPNISTLMALVVNDAFEATPGLERNLPQGVEVMSLARAAATMPEEVEKYYGRLADKADPVAALNTMLVQDGVWVRVRKGVELERPLQIINIFNTSQPLLAARRLLIVLEDGVRASVLLCDHSASQQVAYMGCQVAEVYLGRGASLQYVDMEESSPLTGRLAQFWCHQQEGSELIANGTTLLCGRTRNSYAVDLAGSHASAKLAGMAIASGSQIVDNATRVLHREPECQSDQMFKYILDDQAAGQFYGTIVVDEKARFTKAYQSNRNILASTQARMHTRPQLEIYCDEVKCSHGATVGQLDANALFYMRQRGIPLAEARMMLMQAFMADVIDTVTIPALQSRLKQLVERRLGGHRDLCAACEI